MKKIEIISTLSAAILMTGMLGGCSHNKQDRDSQHAGADYAKPQDQSQNATSASTASTPSSSGPSSDDQSRGQASTSGSVDSTQTEQGGQSASTSTGDQNQTSTTESLSQNAWPALQSQMMKEAALNQLHHVNQEEIQISQWAQDKAHSQQVKTVSQQIMKDHQELDTQVQSVAQSMNIQLRGFQPADWEQAKMDRLQALNGAMFDQAYAHMMKMGHQRVLQDLTWMNKQAKDLQIKQLITDSMARIKAHQKMSAMMTRGLASAPDSSDMSQMPSSSSDMMQGQPSDSEQSNGGMEENTTHQNEQ